MRAFPLSGILVVLADIPRGEETARERSGDRRMKDITSELLAAVVAANAERKTAALAVLRGEADLAARVPCSTGGQRGHVEPYVGLRDVAEFLKVSSRSVWRWRVPGHKLGSRTRFRLSEVAAYLESDEFRRRTAELRDQRVEVSGQ